MFYNVLIILYLFIQNSNAPSPLGQMPPSDGMPGGPMPPAGFFPVSVPLCFHLFSLLIILIDFLTIDNWLHNLLTFFYWFTTFFFKTKKRFINFVQLLSFQNSHMRPSPPQQPVNQPSPHSQPMMPNPVSFDLISKLIPIFRIYFDSINWFEQSIH